MRGSAGQARSGGKKGSAHAGRVPESNFASEDDRRGLGFVPCGREYEDERLESHGGWFGDHDEGSKTSRREREAQGGDLPDEDHHGHGGWFGNRESHSEASRRGWTHRHHHWR